MSVFTVSCRVLVSSALALVLAPGAHAESPSPEPLGSRTLALAAHYSHWEGAYSSQGVGGRFRWEPLPWLGLEGTLEVLTTSRGDERRLDVPLGSRVYAFYEPTPGFRVSGALGLCAMFSLSESARPGAAARDDIQLGFRLAAGAEVELGERLSAFIDAGWQRYLGHSGEVSVWSDALDGELRPVDQVVMALGLMLWL